MGNIITLKKTIDIGSDLCADGQLVLGIPAGAGNIGHAAKEGLASDLSNTSVLSFDCAAVFNTISRAILFEELA